MASPLPDYTPLVEAAVVSYWDVRSRQAQTSKDLGVLDTGIRSEVTGGRHLDELHRLIVRVFIDAGVPADMLEVRKRPIPGFFRRDKSWDVVVTVADRVVGIVELKSMAGEEPDKNYNNRTDEALGQAVDVWKAVERELIDAPLRPWLGYFMLLEDNDSANRSVTHRSPVWPADPVFDQSTYAKRYEIFFDRMVRERLLDAACLVLANKSDGKVQFPSNALSFQTFAAAIHGRCLQFRAMNPDLAWPS
ncbi:MAG: PaeR7I family type II restriction endonuclease [Acidimicrobiales bacterium]